ncbi:hypothetical protein H7I00_16690, partial [Mycobacterium bohemicum]|nr:hypothetical protein [Mycobacterium bohemicum]
AAAQRRRELAGGRDQLTATLTGLCGDEDAGRLRERLEQLRADDPAQPAGDVTELSAARAELETAQTHRDAAAAEWEALRAAAAAAAARLVESSADATVLRNAMAAQRGELDAATERLAQERGTFGDEELSAAAEAGLGAARDAERRVAELAAEL